MPKNPDTVPPGSVAQIKNLEGGESAFFIPSHAWQHALAVAYGALTSRPPGHDRCVMCDVAFGKVTP